MQRKALIAGVILSLAGVFYLVLQDTPEVTPVKSANASVSNGLRNVPIPSVKAATARSTEEPSKEEINRKISESEIESYLDRRKRGPENLLAAYQVSADPRYLREAASRFPNDPQVQLAVLMEDLFPDDRRKWIDALKVSSPNDPIGNYLSALDHLKQNNSSAAIQDLTSAGEKKGFNSFDLEGFQNREELFLSTGMSAFDAKMEAFSHRALNLESNFKALTVKMVELRKTLIESGDSASADTIIRAGVIMSRHLTEGNGAQFVISQLVGIGTETTLLKQLEPDRYYEFLQQTAGERILALQKERAIRKEMAGNLATLYSRLTPEEAILYIDRIKLYGELNAYQWMKDKFGDK